MIYLFTTKFNSTFRKIIYERNSFCANVNIVIKTFNCKHLLSINSNLSQIESWMKSLPMRKYMKALRRLYNQNYTEEQIIEYMFTDEKLKRIEYLYRTRDKSREVKRIVEEDKSIHEKP